MKKSARNLSIRMKGEDVQNLQAQLRQLGYTLNDREGTFGKTTRRAVTDFQARHHLRATGIVDARTAKQIDVAINAPSPKPVPRPTQFTIHGQVRQADGSLLIGGTVRAFDKDLRSEEFLGEAIITDRDGRYEIKYTAAQFLRAEKRSADLIVRVLSREGLPLAASPIIFNAQPEETVDLVIGGEEYRGPSEYEQHLAELTPVLQGIQPADLTEEDVAFLAGETGINPEHIAFLVVGARLGQKTDLRAEAFYGLFRQNLPTDLPALLAQSPEVQRRALETALRDNIIPATLRNEIDAILERLRQLIVEHAFQPPAEQGRASLGDLLNTVLPIRGKQKAFLDRYVRHEGPVENFWKDLRENPEFRGDVDNLQFTLQLGVLTQNHLPLVRELRTRPEKTLKSLAKMEAADWRELIRKQVDGKPIGFPPDVPGKDDEEKASNYAKIMTRMIEDAFPTAVIASRIEKDNLPGKSDLLTFFGSNPNFDFRTTHIESYLTQNAGALNGVADKASLTNQLKGMQRVFKLTPRYSEMRVLLADNLSSAHAITRLGQTAFMIKYGEPLGGRANAKLIYENAEQITATALNLLAQYGMASSKVSLQSVSDKSLEQVDGIPNWATLFGSLDLCECEDCRSVYSPAAYLVDALHFLNDRKLVDKTAKDILFERRPDLGEIELTCENTNTPLPYVDLVNEVLENAVSPFAPFTPFTIAATLESDLDNRNLSPALQDAFSPSLSPNAVIAVGDKGRWWRIIEAAYTYTVKKDAGTLHVASRSLQTHGTPQELSANPQYLNPGAYDTLRQQVYPWNLPFDLWSEEARTYLEHLGVRRDELMETFQKIGALNDPTDLAIASEYLRLTTIERQIITGSALNPPREAWELWGLQENNNQVPDPGNPENLISLGWLQVIERVRLFLDRSGLTYQELDELLKIKFINPDRDLRIVSNDEADPATCDTAKLVIENLTAATASRIHRFVRLWRKLRWTMRELDQAITALQAPIVEVNLRLNDAFLLRLSHLKRLRASLNLPVEQVLALWANIDTDGDDALYQRLFQNPAVLKPVDEAFKLNGAELDVVTAAPAEAKISKHTPTILAALRISAADLAALTATEVIDDALNLANLSKLYRISILAKGLRLSITDTLTLKALTGIDPFDVAHTEDTLRFVEVVEKIRASRFSMAELDYLLRHQFVVSSRIAPTEQSIALVLDEIRVGLQKIAADNTFAPDPTGELTQKKLAILLKSDDVAKAMALLDGTSTDTQAAEEAFIDHHFSTQTEFARFLSDTTDAKAKLVGATPFAEKQERFEYVLKPLLGYLAQASSRSLVKQKLSEALKLDAATAEQLLTQWVSLPAHPAQKSMDEFLAETFAKSDLQVKLTATAFPDQFRTFTLLHKIALLISKFKLTPQQVSWLFDYGPGVGWLDLSSLPLDATNSASGLFTGWERLVDLFQLREALPLGESVLSDIFTMARDAATTEAALLQQLSERTGWNKDDLQFLAGAQGFGFAFPEAYKDERALVRLKAGFAMMRRLGVSAEQCRAWAKPELTSDDARNIKQAVKAKYDDEQWLTIARPLRDILREKQRAALVSYLVAHPDSTKGQTWNDANGLYEYFLIDVEMSPCQMTSRIKQALSSVQLFVQRCLVSLEPEVAANAEVDKKWREWKWMKNYRVWEANRKVFLYPENWIEPELRDDKSPFFKDLENELLQNEVTMDTAEAAFLNYLEKLDAVAQLEICGMYHQVEKDWDNNTVVDFLHVFGRTHNTPHIYYYRQRVNSAYWTAWEKVDLDIEGDHLIPVIWNRRLHLFWPIFTEEAEEQESFTITEGEPVSSPPKRWKIQIAWSEYKNKKWSPKKISKKTIEIPDPEIPEILELVPRGRFFFEVRSESGDLVISIKWSLEPTAKWFVQWRKSFCLAGCQGKVDVKDEPYLAGKLPLLPETHHERMSFVENQDKENPLVLFQRAVYVPTLRKTPGTFRVNVQQFPYVEGYLQPGTVLPFFYADDARTFFVIPGDMVAIDWSIADRVQPGMLDRIRDHYYASTSSIRNLIGPTVNPSDSMLYEPSHPVELGLSAVTATRTSGAAGTLTPRMMSVGATSAAVTTSGPLFMRSGNGVEMSAFLMSNVADMLRNRAASESRFPHDPVGQGWVRQYRFETFYHPYACLFVRELNRDGIDGLMQRPIQIEPHTFLNPPQAFDFAAAYDPDPRVVLQPYLQEDVDFSHNGAYAQYNWELFFHVPFMIADRLRENQRFEDAQKWFHYIFDPTDTSSLDVPQKYWRTRPFHETAKPEYLEQQIKNLLKRLASDQPDPELDMQVSEWRDHPFNPHLIARLRAIAYQKTVVMKYIDNLIAWGDQLFRRDTIESINEAAQLYILAAEILGRRPENIPPRATPQVQTYNSLEPLLQPDDFSDPLVAIENLIPPSTPGVVAPEGKQPTMTLPTMLYFCVPKNDKLLGYWDKVADRLFKIRHCMNIEGVVRQLPLFEPPIEPGLLVRAAALGVDLTSALNDINAALPHYRFNVMAQKASELCADLKSLGGALLSALEKRDAEALALLRSTHEINVLNAVRQVREKQIEEAKQALEGLKKARDMVNIRHTYYANIQFMNPAEMAHLALSGLSLKFQEAHAKADLIAAVLHLIPNLKIAPPPSAGTTTGGDNIGSGIQAFGSAMGSMGSILNTVGSMSATYGGYQRRSDDWKLQERLAARELQQMEKQIIAAEIRLAIAERELQNHDLQIENAKEVDAYMHDKFTNRELYDWMVSQISSIYFQSYQLVYDVAKRTERAYRYELGLDNSNFIQFGYWDSLKKGLLAGERLHYDLKRMEIAYLDQNKREYEITQSVSLAMLDPIALVMLKETGQCFVNLPEAIFDLDYPGHYMQRIKSVSLTIPCVTGPYTSVNCTLTLLNNSVRINPAVNGNDSNGYRRAENGDDPRFRDNVGAIQSIATSNAQNDSGVFELNFRDERYLPFEGAGVISSWRLELPSEFRQFDYDTITDVIFHLRYTAREGGSTLKEKANEALRQAFEEQMLELADGRTGLFRLFSARHEFPNKWHQFLYPPGDQILTLDLTQERFPFMFRDKEISITKVELFLKLKDGFESTDGDGIEFSLTYPGGQIPETGGSNPGIVLHPSPALGGLLHAEQALTQSGSPGSWSLQVTSIPTALLKDGRLNPDSIEDIGIVCHYTVAERST